MILSLGGVLFSQYSGEVQNLRLSVKAQMAMKQFA
jgi:hypothetical protein